MSAKCMRVLHVFASLDRGGAETMIVNLYRKIDRDRVQFDFVACEREEEYAYEELIYGLGGSVFYVPKISPVNLYNYFKAWKGLLKVHPEWEVIHIHHASTSGLSIPVAKAYGRTVIVHSHTAGSDGSIKSWLRVAAQFPSRYYADKLFACSVPAASWMFGNQGRRAKILNNSIDMCSFQPDLDVRRKIRTSLNIGSVVKVIGHVGRFVEVKNHAFMLKVLDALVALDPSAIVIFVGDGVLKESIASQADEMGLSRNVRFTGVRSDIADLMQGMDAFIFPSLYEGLPVTLVEAQASGLPCLVSDTVSQEVKLTECIEFMSLDTPVEAWAARLLEMATQVERRDTQADLAEAGYDVHDNAKWLQNYYLDLVESR